MKRYIPMIARIIGAGVLIRFAYDETGPYTAVLLVLLVLGLEAQAALWRRLVTELDPKKIW
jgi:hypothetical protein